jgi:putative ATP-dependent endonuclease of the OLD family
MSVITRLRIEGFRSIDSLVVELPRLCAFVGANNTGKSNILRALEVALGRSWVSRTSFTEQDVIDGDHDRDVRIKLELDPAPTFRAFKASAPVDVPILEFLFTRYQVGDRKGERRLEQKCLQKNGKPVPVPASAPKKGVKTSFKPLTSIPDEVRDQVPLIYVGTDRAIRQHLPSYRRSLLQQLFDDVADDLENDATLLEVDEIEATRLQHFNRLISGVLSVLRTDEFQSVEDGVRQHALKHLGLAADSGSLDFHFGPLSPRDFYRALELVVSEHGFDLPATELGQGVQNALVLAILKVFEERRKQGAILLIEEPEMFLHPQTQRSLYRTLREISRTNQVIYVTHSPHFVSIPEFDEVIRVTKPNGRTVVRRSTLPITDALREKARKELDPERNELFFASRLLLVEGDTEKFALREYALRLGLDIDAAGATIVEVGGKRNLPAFLDIAASFQIPTGVIYDRDSNEFKNRREEEEAFNATLDSRDSAEGGIKVWQLAKDYEEELRNANGDKLYEALCQKHSGVSKAVRARLIAADHESAIFPVIELVLEWLTDSTSREPSS